MLYMVIERFKEGAAELWYSRDARAFLVEDGCNEALAVAGANVILKKY